MIQDSPLNLFTIDGSVLKEYHHVKGVNPNIIVPDHITEVSAKAFSSKKVKSVVFPNSVKTIGEECFDGCRSLRRVHLPEGLETMESYMFYGCINLENVYIPASVKKIGDCIFIGCNNFSISAPKGSFAIAYAKESGISYEEVVDTNEIYESVSEFEDVIKYSQISFGSYIQSSDDGAKEEPLIWDIIEEKDDKLLVMCHKCIDFWLFSDKPEPRWRRSEIRKWLNETFYVQSFSTEEKERILLSDSPLNGILKPTKDYVFLLSGDECKKLEPSYRKARLTPYTRRSLFEKYKIKHPDPYAYWILRTAKSDSRAYHIEQIYPSGGHGWVLEWMKDPFFIRPAMWIKKAGDGCAQSDV